jgi:hypothetical protein
MTHLTEKDLTPSNEGNFKTGLLKYVAWRLEIHGDKELANLVRKEFLTKEK